MTHDTSNQKQKWEDKQKASGANTNTAHMRESMNFHKGMVLWNQTQGETNNQSDGKQAQTIKIEKASNWSTPDSHKGAAENPRRENRILLKDTYSIVITIYFYFR